MTVGKIKHYILVLAILAPLFAIVPAWAQQNPTIGARVGPQDKTHKSIAEEPPLTDADLKAELEERRKKLAPGIDERVKSRKASHSMALTPQELDRLRSRCQVSQPKLEAYDTKMNTKLVNRNRSYAQLSTVVSGTIRQLREKGIDVAELERQEQVLQEKIVTFQSNMKIYQEALYDTHAMKCVADPAGYRVSLEAARGQVVQLKKDVTGIQDFVAESIKPTLIKIRTDLAAIPGEGGR